MSRLIIHRARLEVMHHYGMLLCLLTFSHDGKRIRYHCRWLDYVGARVNRDYWICRKGHLILSIRPAEGPALTDLDRFLLLYPLSISGRARIASPLTESIFNAYAYGFDIQDSGHYGLFFYDDDEENGHLAEYDADAVRDYARRAVLYAQALRNVGRDAFAEDLSQVITFGTEKTERGEIASRRPRWFRPYDEAFHAMRPTLNECLERFIGEHREEIFAALPDAEYYINQGGYAYADRKAKARARKARGKAAAADAD